MSGSTHIPPTGIHCPAATLSAMRANSSGSRAAIHAYCWACEHENRYSGASSISATADANVRVHLRTVSPIGHSHAVSMWAWPVATTRWAPERAGSAERGGDRGARRRDGVVAPARRGGQQVQGAADGDADAGAPRVVEGERAHRAVEDIEVVQQRLGGGVDDDELGPLQPVQRVGTGGRRRPERRRAELRQQRVRRGLDDELDRSGLSGHRHGLAPGVDALHGSALGVAHEALALEARGIGPEAEVEERLDPPARPRRRHLAGEAEPRRAPRRSPALADGERRQVVEPRPGLDGEGDASRVHERQDALGQLARDAFLDELAVVVHRPPS